jgi:hypothetical protein
MPIQASDVEVPAQPYPRDEGDSRRHLDTVIAGILERLEALEAAARRK